MVHALIFIPPDLPDDSSIADRCQTYITRRGYQFLTFSRNWDEVEWFIGTGRAQVVVFADPAHIERPVPAEIAAEIAEAKTGRIKAGRRDPEQSTLVKAVGRCPVPQHPAATGRAVILIPPGQMDRFGARCAQLAEHQGLTVVGVVQDLAAAVKAMHEGEARVLIVGTEDHLHCPDGMCIEIVANQPAPSGARRSKLIRRQ